ncbi:MAG TPA: MraY family glycosyltransferase, partial [Planctomycetaceae bacterium]|nr:MraY family glycosyltransferase [Planctomycetaceae bacterium]
DGLDGLAGTVGLILTASIAGLAAMKGATEATLLALVFAGCLLGFLVHNWPPAKIFLGDSGSLLIGFVVGGLSIEASLKTTTGFALAVPLVLLSVPVFDTSMAIARRVLAGRGIGEGDRLHIHHRLQARGLSRGQALLAISGLCAAMAGVTLLSARFNSDVVALGMCVFLLALLIYGRVFGYDETLLFLRRARATFSAVSTYAARGEMRRAVLALSAGDPDWDAAWETITRQLESLGAQRLDLKISAAPDGEDAYHRQWRLDDTQLQNTHAFVRTGGWRVSLSLARPGGTTAAAEADGTEAVPASGTIPLDAVRLLAAVCQYWPHPSPAGEENSSVPVIPLRTQPDAAEERRRAA